MNILLELTELIGCLTGIGSFLCLLVRPIRNRIVGIGDIKEGQKCLLRNEMLHTYYKHRDEEKIRQYEFENFIFLYKAYKKLGGNSFIEKIYSEIQTWEVCS